MYLQHFQFTAEPFSIAPDPRFLFLSMRHEEALAHLIYGLREGGGFVALTGEVGTGKTTLCYCLIDQLPENVDLALVFNPKLSSLELIATICDELGIAYPENNTSIKVVTDALNQYLLEAHAKGRRTVVLIDEAQNLSLDVLEQIRLLTNLETKRTKLLQIILVGQPELNTLLNCKELRQLSQRVTGRYHLIPLDYNETREYIRHRLMKVGARSDVFSVSAQKALFRHSKGIPRLLNTIADRSLLGAFSNNQFQVSAGLVDNAAKEILNMGKRFPWQAVLAGLVAGVALVTLGWFAWHYGDSNERQIQNEVKIVKPIEPVVAKKPVKIEVPTTKKVLPQLLTNQLHQQKLTLAAAFTRLFSEFGLKVNDEQIVNPCEMAKQNGYLCLVETGNWRQILQFDRPAILELEDNAGQKYHVVLKKVADDKIYLDLGKEPEFVTTLSQLVPLWNGNYVQLWKPFGPGKYILRQGDQGKNVFKLRELLAAFDDKSLETVTPLIFDEVLTRIVTQFQIKSGLDADGVVGPKTWILLNNSVDTGRPWLIMKGD